MSQAITIARPYAQAAFEFAQNENAIPAWKEALMLLAQVVEHEEIKLVYRNPEVSRKDFMAVLVDLVKLEKDSPIYNFVRLLITNKRLLAAREISERFIELQNQAQDVVDVDVTTVIPLNDDEKVRITKRLKEKLGRNIALQCNTDDQMLGGMIVQYGDKVIDVSLRSQIERLARDLTVQTEVK